MLEYIFFDQRLQDKFIAFLKDKSIAAVCPVEDEMLVQIPDDIDDSLSDAIDLYYEELLQENAELLEQTEDALEKDVAGVQVVLANGEICMVRLEPDLVSRLLQSMDMAELRDMVQSVAEQVENPDNRPLCHT